ncbi:hypothetical protein SETIT_3G155700v2 [Setaria italica]|uniref:Uncharacterized protein n=1 Tax=Setaria italica TaxID=4555 RepID=K3Z410_SETIT|nr:uncharacterized protein LOC101775092 [Setaria italica]XP_022680886.1 uncharacterized protein LOC101775092 [Setaria italica]RCV16656.1 hypothetical protein SETIT_3G155700v2 [Setaria italica]
MSEFVRSRYDKQEDFQVLLSKKDPGESPQHKHYLWMAHWTKASSSAEPQNNNISNPLEDINKGSTTKHSETLPYEFMKSTVAERLMVGVSRGSASMQHAQQFNSSMWGVAHHVCNELGAKNNEQVDESFEKSMKKNAVNLRAREVVSEAFSVHKLSELPLDFQKLGSSEDPSSDWSHFPMFEINRKIDNILNPKRRSELGPASLNLNMSTSHVMALSSQEYMMNSQRIADDNMEMCKSARGFASRIEDPAGLNSDPSGKKLKRKLLDTMSCSCSKNDNDSSDCPIDDQHTSHHFAKAKQELPCASNEKKFMFAANNDSRIVSSAFHNLETRRSAVLEQQNDAEAMFCAPVLGREFQNEPITISNNRKKDVENLHETYKSRGKAVSCCLQPYERQHLKTQRTESAANLKGCILPDQSANKFTEKSKSNGELLTHGPKSTEMYTGSCNRRGPCLFEKLTIPSKSQSAHPKNSASSGKSSGFGVCMYGTNIGSQLFGAQNQSSAKTETLYSDTLIRSKSSAGIASLPAQKDYGCPDEAKSEQLATPPRRGDSRFSKDDRFHNVNEHHDVSSKATIASKQSCMPGTRITNLDLILSQMSRMRNQISSGMVQPPIGAEPSDRWLKRLQLDISDPDIPGSKRPKIGDSPPLGETKCLFDMALPCNKIDGEMIGCAKEDQGLDEGNNELQDKQERTSVPAKSMNSWIGRWCQGGTSVFHEDLGQGRQERKPDQPSEELEGQFPSIAAMAMMGRVMNKLRPCEHQKKGPFVVWKTD